jgi:hypothetical protein
MKQVFEDIVQNWRWKKHPCGPGSTLNYTEQLRNKLAPLLLKHSIHSMFDAPCGDYSWMCETALPDIKYSGGDIVEFMIEQNKLTYPNVEFCVFDLTQDPIPKVDVLFCRDCLLHLSFEAIDHVLANISSSDIKYVLMSNWFEDAENHRDIDNGNSRYIDFTQPPYNFGPPVDSIVDYVDGFPRREMMLWPKPVVDLYIKRKTS